MKAFLAFTKKELLEQLRSGRLLILLILCVLMGVMNPAIAKLTPWLLEVMSDSLAESGMSVTAVEVTAMDSWVQFFKNLPMLLIAFVLLESSIFTKEYATGTLLLSLTKGLQRYKVVLSKALVLILLWTVGYWLSFGITYLYNDYFWDNAVARNLLPSVLYQWLFGMWITAACVLFSTVSTSNTGVLLGAAGVTLASYLLGLLPKLGKYTPTYLLDGNSLIYGLSDAKAYLPATVIACVTGGLCFVFSVPVFNKKQL